MSLECRPALEVIDWSVHEIAATTGQGSVWKERTEVLWVNRDLHDVLPFGDVESNKEIAK